MADAKVVLTLDSFSLATECYELQEHPRQHTVSIIHSNKYLQLYAYEPIHTGAATRRCFATVQDAPPVKRYGGLRDQDRIFTNAYCRHDHGIKGAKVSKLDVITVSTFVK
jgi:hypothetical protein